VAGRKLRKPANVLHLQMMVDDAQSSVGLQSYLFVRLGRNDEGKREIREGLEKKLERRKDN
jgi:hypothetical protein